MKVIALKPGFYNGGRVRPGAVFDVEDGEKAGWFAPLEEHKAKAESKPKGKTQQAALSQLGKEAPKSMTDVMAKGADDIA